MSAHTLQDDLGFALEYHTVSAAPYTVPHIRDARGVLRRASPEEEKLWKALEDATAKLGEGAKKKGR